MPLATKSRLGPYQVVSLIGAGSMGEVYRARDTRLQRDVALKIIDLRITDGDDDRIRRFEQEAQSASGLNHPNIVTIHDVGREDHLSYIVTELVEGESLRAHLQKHSPMKLKSILDIGIQIAEGLSEAHDHGIVHRDLKPENIMITRDSRVKILDFGLAKPAEKQLLSGEDNRTIGANATAPGVVFGTVPYMSPEQAKGGRVNFFADQFALGVILYELVSGTHPFRRENPLQTLSAILTEDPPLLTEGTPALQWLVRRCLHREPDHRYASTHDVVRELRSVRDNLTETGELEAVVAPVERLPLAAPRDWLRPVLTLLAVVLAGVVGYMLANWMVGVGSGSWSSARFVPFAVEAGMEVFPAWAPNGKSVAYAAEADGVFQIMVRSNGAAASSQLTRLPGDSLFPFWSPDGQRIYFISRQSLWSVGATGGSPESVLDNVVQAAISSDGRTLAALRAEGGSYTLWTGAVPGYKLQRYEHAALKKALLPWSYLRFTPDGTQLGAWLSVREGHAEFWMIPLPDGEPRRLFAKLESFPMAREFAWDPSGRYIVYGERSHLWRADVSPESISRITNGSGAESSPSISASGREMVFTSTDANYDLVRIGLDGRIEDVIATPTLDASPAASVKGQFAYVTERRGRPEIWFQHEPLITSGMFGEEVTNSISDAAFSPDGARIAYSRSASKDEAIWISTLTGDPPVRLARESGRSLQRSPTWSPDGNSIAYFSLRGGKNALMRARVGGIADPVVLAENAGTDPRWSPKGDWIAGIGADKGLTLVSADGKQRKDVGSGQWLLHGWSADGKALYGVRATSDRRLEVVSLRDGVESVLADMGRYPAAFTYGMASGSLPLRGFSMDANGNGFLTSMLRARSDLWMIDRER